MVFISQSSVLNWGFSLQGRGVSSQATPLERNQNGCVRLLTPLLLYPSTTTVALPGSQRTQDSMELPQTAGLPPLLNPYVSKHLSSVPPPAIPTRQIRISIHNHHYHHHLITIACLYQAPLMPQAASPMESSHCCILPEETEAKRRTTAGPRFGGNGKPGVEPGLFTTNLWPSMYVVPSYVCSGNALSDISF